MKLLVQGLINIFLLALCWSTYSEAEANIKAGNPNLSAYPPDLVRSKNSDSEDRLNWSKLKLIDSAGEVFTIADLQGKFVLLNFFFTSCPGICPPQTAGLVQTLKNLDSEVLQSITFLSVSLDSENDTQEKLIEYKKRFEIEHGSWIFAGSDKETITSLASEFGSIRNKDEPLDHRALVYLLGPGGNVMMSYPSSPFLDSERMVADLEQVVKVLGKNKLAKASDSVAKDK